MMASQQIPVKVYYMENGTNKEIRKFTLDQDVATSYAYLMGRIKVFFASLLRKDLQLYWKDEEDDYISVSSDSELFEVMKGVTCDNAQDLKLYIKVKASTSVPINNQHIGIACDVCDSTINGIRYKCTICPDYDLCSTCEGKQIHPIDHILLCIKKPGPTRESFMLAPGIRMGRPSWKFGSQSNCPFRRFNIPSSSSEKERKSEKPCATQFKEFIQQMAPSLGFDPDVVVSQVQSLFDHFNSETEAGCGSQSNDHCCGKESHKEEGTSQQEQDNATKDDVPKDEDLLQRNENESKEINPEDTLVPENMSVPENTSVPENVSDPIVENATATPPPTHPDSRNAKDDLLAETVTPFLNHMGIFGEINEDQLQSFGTIMEKAMQSIGLNVRSSPSTGNENTAEVNKDTEQTGSNGFVFVDEKNKRSEITEEEMFERRLNEALHQMEAMGFENDGDWLKSLLVAKDLDISRVLDALKSSKE